MTEEDNKHQIVDQYISEIEHYKQITNSFGESTVREVVYALIQSNEDIDLVFSLFEDAGMWRHAMCLNEMVFKKWL